MQGGAPPFDALLLDLHLPDGSGLELLRELRAAAATRAFPVIVLTAEGEERILREAESLGAGLLTKPFSPSKLTARIAALLGDAPPPPPPSPPSAPPGPRRPSGPPSWPADRGPASGLSRDPSDPSSCPPSRATPPCSRGRCGAPSASSPP